MNLEKFNQFLKQLSKKGLPVIDADISMNKYIKIDLSEKNKEEFDFDISSSKDWENYLHLYLNQGNFSVAFGGYLEQRNLYDRSNYFKNLKENDKRNIHLGIDLWCKQDTKVLAVLDGEVHSFKNNNNHGNYGPTVILKHKIDGQKFYTLYGHLSISSLKNLSKGSKVLKGTTIGFIGNSSVNGDYSPHLHFQIIRDIESYFGDYPGVASKKNIEFYKNNCPDPNLLLKLNKIKN